MVGRLNSHRLLCPVISHFLGKVMGLTCMCEDQKGMKNSHYIYLTVGFSGGSDGKESDCNAGDPGLIPGSGRFPGERNGYPHQYSYLENSMNREDC